MSDSNPTPTPHVGLFWVVRTAAGALRLLGASCPLTEAELYGDCLTYGPGHYETWTRWRQDRSLDPALREIVRTYEYESWPRGRSVFHRPRNRFILYADRQLQTPSLLAAIQNSQKLPPDRTVVHCDGHYQSTQRIGRPSRKT